MKKIHDFPLAGMLSVFLFIPCLLSAQVPGILNYQGRVVVNGTNFDGRGQFMFALVDGGTNTSRQARATPIVSYGFVVSDTITDGGAGYIVPPKVSYTGGSGSGAAAHSQIGGGSVTNIVIDANGSGYDTTPPTVVIDPPPANMSYRTFWSNGMASISLPVVKGLYAVILGDTAVVNMTAIPPEVFTNADVRLRVWFNDGANGWQQLTPDQRIAAVGYALMAANVPDGAITSNKLAVGAVTGTAIANGAIGSAQLASNLTISGTLTAGNIQGNGAGITNVPGTLPWQVVAGTTQQAAPNTAYLATNAAQVVVTLPAAPNVGDVVKVAGGGAGGWAVAANSNQSILGVAGVLTWTACASSQTWTSVASSADGTKLVAVVNGGQIWTSADSGASWTNHASNQYWQSVASSTDGTKLVAAVRNGQIFASTDSGANWNSSNNSPSTNWQCVASSTDGTKLVAVANGGEIYTSYDSGTNWNGNNFGFGWQSVASSADGTKLVVGGFWYRTNCLISTNSGVTWTGTTISVGEPVITVASSADGTKLFACMIGGDIWTSTDSGSNWTHVNRLMTPQFPLALSADGTKLVAVVYGGQIWTSANSGSNWTAEASTQNWKSVASSADGTKLVAVVFGGQIWTSGSDLTGAQGTMIALQFIGNGQWQVMKTSQTGATTLGAGVVTTDNLASDAVTGDKIAAGSVGSAQLASNLTISGTLTAGSFQGNGAMPWQIVTGTTQQAAPDTAYLATNAAQVVITLPAAPNVGDVVEVSGGGAGGWEVAANSNQSILGCTAGAVGSNWMARASTQSWSSVASSADGTKLVAVVGASWRTSATGQIWTSTDSGSNWNCSINSPSTNWQSVASSLNGTKLVAAVFGGQIWTSSDAGTNWTARASTQLWWSVASSADGNKLVAAAGAWASPGQIWTSTDAGLNWMAHGDISNWWSVASSADGNNLVASAMHQWGGEIWTSKNAGTDWTKQPGFPASWYSGSCLASSADGNRLVAGTVVEMTGFYIPSVIWCSANAGLTWTAGVHTQYWWSVASSADGSKLVAVGNGHGFDGSPGQMDISTDAGATWTTCSRNTNWQSVALSADGTKLVAVVQGGQIYTCSSQNSTLLTGAQGTTAILQYIGNGQWQVMNPSQAAATTLGDGAVTTDNLASGAVTGDKIAAGAVGSAQLASNLTVTGTLTATSVSGDGSALSNLNASALASGVVPSGRLLGTYSSPVTISSGTNDIFGGSFNGNGAGLFNLNAGQLASGIVPDARLSGTYSSVLTLNNATNSFNGAFTGNGSGLTNLNAGQLASGILPSARLLGTYASAVSLTNGGNSFTGNGSGLTNLNASQLASGIVPGAQLSGTYYNALYLTNGGNSFTGNGSGLTNLNASALASGFVPSARLLGTYASAVSLTNGGNSFTGNGSGLTNLSASQLASGIVPGAQLSGTYYNALYLTNGGNSFTGNGSGLTNLNAGQLASGIVPSARLLGTYFNVLTLTNAGNSFTGTYSGNGAGITNVPGTLPWQVVPGTTQLAAPNTGYVLTNAAQTIVTLPATANVGDVVQVSGLSAGGLMVTGNIVGVSSVVGTQGTVSIVQYVGNSQWQPLATVGESTLTVNLNNEIAARTNALKGLVVHLATSENTSANSTFIDNPLCNGQANAIVLVTHNWSRDTAANRQETAPVGVSYDGTHWNIYHEDNSAMPLGRAFNVMVVGP